MERQDYEPNLKGESHQMSKYINVGYRDVENFLVRSKYLSSPKRNSTDAALMAVALFWCATGAGLLIAYEYEALHFLVAISVSF